MKALKFIVPLTVGLLAACQDQVETPTAATSQAEKSSVAEKNSDQILLDFEASKTPSSVSFSNASAELVSTKGVVSQGSQALRVKFDSINHTSTGITIEPETPFDWSDMKDFSLAFDIANQGETSVHLSLGVTDIKGQSFTRAVNIPVGTSKTYYSKMHGHDVGSPKDGAVDEKVELNLSSGLRSNPATWESDDVQFVWMWGTKNLDLSGITKITLSTANNLRAKEITLDNVRLMPHPEMNPNYLANIVDKFGQSARMEFPEKVHSDEELLAQRDAELKQLQNGKLLDDRSKYSGWKKGPKLAGTGYFRTEKVDGKWWLVDPEGYLYIATGIDIIRLANSTTITGYDFDPSAMQKEDSEDVTPEDSEGLNPVGKAAQKTRHLVSDTRAKMFEWLPESYDDALGNHFGYRKSVHSGPLDKGEVFSFYSANLERKYGETSPESFLDNWKEVTIDRMRNWGFTSLGNWTDPMYYDNAEIPFFANGWIIGDFKTVSSGNDFWSPLPDVFDPEFARRAEITVKTIAEEVKNSPWCVGVFIDNEKSWGRSDTRNAELGIVIHTLTQDGKDSPTKAKFTEVMQGKYGEIARLNQAWETDIADWAEFDKGGFNSKLNNQTQDADYGLLLKTYAGQYFKVVNQKMKQFMPNHLYFGVRFASWGMPPEVVEASVPYSDVVSFNNYKPGVIPKSWEFLKELDKPAMIGEFHFGTTASGFFHPGLIHAADQKDRATMYKDYMRSVFANDYFIGAHWFQYLDSPITGRAYDGENYNVGFVTVADVPYEEMIKAAKELHTEMYKGRYERK